MSQKVLIITVLLVVCVSSCTKNRRKDDAVKIVREWTGREIRFPENVPCYVLGKDTLPELCDDCFHKDYKILLYVDSTGCSRCRLMLFEWKRLIEDTDSLFPGKVGFLLYFQPKSVKDLSSIFAHDRFKRPVFMDTDGRINRMNRFPEDMKYQCFLLDSANRVLLTGNPVASMKIWELYKSQISDGKKIETRTITSIKIDKLEHNYGTIRKGSTDTAAFKFTNTGKNALFITRVTTSCGCTGVTWDKQPVKPGKSTVINVEMTPDEAGVLRKTVAVYCNTSDSPTKITLVGTVTE